MTQSEAALMRRLVSVANARFDGYLAVLKSAADWRIGFEVPSGRDGVAAMAAGTTFHEAAGAALAAVGEEGLS